MDGKENNVNSLRLPSDAYMLGDDLLNRAKESVETQSVLPILKDELRLKIQAKRLSQGLEELKVDFQIKPPTPLTPEEKQKQEIRKSNNRESAKQCRLKRKNMYSSLQQEMFYLEDENRRLKQKIRVIESEKDTYLSNIVKHPVMTQVLTDIFRSNISNWNSGEVIYQQN